jgi:hypothetical protein
MTCPRHSRGKADLPLAAEQVGHGAVGAEVAAALAEGMAHLGHRAIAVVGHRLDKDATPPGA